MKIYIILLIFINYSFSSFGQSSKTYEGHIFKVNISRLDGTTWIDMDMDQDRDFIIKNNILMFIDEGHLIYKLLKINVDLKTKHSTVILWDALDENKKKCQIKLFTLAGSRLSTLEIKSSNSIDRYKCFLN